MRIGVLADNLLSHNRNSCQSLISKKLSEPLKEKRLVNPKLFDEMYLREILTSHLIGNESVYYKAILQNVFFATLNTEMPKDNPKSRTFVEKDNKNEQTSKHQMFNYY